MTKEHNHDGEYAPKRMFISRKDFFAPIETRVIIEMIIEWLGIEAVRTAGGFHFEKKEKK